MTMDMASGGKAFVDLANYRRAATRFWFVVLAVAILGGIAGAIGSGLQEPAYRSTAVVQVNDGLSLLASDVPPPSPNMATEQQVARSTKVTAVATKALGTGLSPTDFQERATASYPPDANTLSLTFTGTTRALAQKGAEAWAQAYLANRTAEFNARLQSAKDKITAAISDLNTALTAAQAALTAAVPDSAAALAASTEIAQLNAEIGPYHTTLNQYTAFVLNAGDIISEPVEPISKDGLPRSIYVILGILIGIVLGAVATIVLERLIGRVRNVGDVRPVVGPLAWPAGRLGTRVEAPGVASVALRLPMLSNGRHTTIIVTDLDNSSAARGANSLATALASDDVEVDVSDPRSHGHALPGPGVHLVVAPNVLQQVTANAMARADGVVLVIERGSYIRDIRAAAQVILETDSRLLATLVSDPPVEARILSRDANSADGDSDSDSDIDGDGDGDSDGDSDSADEVFDGQRVDASVSTDAAKST